jgi:hypothetical protein
VTLDLAQLVGGAVGGALITSVVGPLISQRHERRDVRANVLRAVAEVERARWAPAEREPFRATIINLRSAALVAGVNREAVESYARLAQYAQRMSEDSWEVIPDEEFGGGIPGSLGDLTRHAATLVTDIVWHPYRKRRSVTHGLAKLRADEGALRAGKADRDIPWDIPLF